jgi:hypothetical protein
MKEKWHAHQSASQSLRTKEGVAPGRWLRRINGSSTTTSTAPTITSFATCRNSSVRPAYHYPKNERYFVRFEIEMRRKNSIDGMSGS